MSRSDVAAPMIGTPAPARPRGAFARLRARVSEESRATGLPLGALLVLAILLHLGVTLRAVNPYHPDEHFQILEFAWARAGLAPLSDLAWEFGARIRPTLQPTLALVWLRALRAVGVTSPWAWVLGLRLATLALALAVVARVAAHVAPTLGRAGRRTLWLCALFLWCAPLFTARFTSENWSGLALAAALPLIEEDGGAARDAWIGVLLGLAFVLRFQSAFAIGALLLWLVVRAPRGWTRAATACAVAAAVVALATLGDVWFYQGWVFTPWEYFRTNLIQGVASKFGTEPWYWYALMAPLWMAPPVGLAVVALAALGALARPKSPWVWAVVAFFVGHSAVAHKEIRFLLPMLYLLPVLVAFGVDALAARWSGARASAPAWARATGWILLAQNAVLALVLLTPSIHRGKNFDWHFYRFLWETAEAQPAPLWVLESGEDPYLSYSIETHVYRHPRVRPVAFSPGASLDALVPPGTPLSDVLVVTRDTSPPPLAGAHRYELVWQAEPGYRITARQFGLEGSPALAWLERVDKWTDADWVHRVYRIAS